MRNRTLGGPECLAAIRRIGPDIVRLMDDDHSLKGRMEIAAMSDKHLLGMLANAIGKFQERRRWMRPNFILTLHGL